MTISKSLMVVGFLVCASDLVHSRFHPINGFALAEKRELHGLKDWPPIQEPWRCLESSSTQAIESFNAAIQSMSGISKDDPDCPLITPEICVYADFFPVPCNCHAYVRCFQMDFDGPLMPCIYKCKPYDLIFSPNEGVCVLEIEAPPGICFDTPLPPSQD